MIEKIEMTEDERKILFQILEQNQAILEQNARIVNRLTSTPMLLHGTDAPILTKEEMDSIVSRVR